MLEIKKFITDLKRLAMFVGAILLLKFWLISVPLLLAGAVLYKRHKG